MTTDNEYSDMGICPNCLSEGFDGVCDTCGYIDCKPDPTPFSRKRDIDYNYLRHSEGD